METAPTEKKPSSTDLQSEEERQDLHQVERPHILSVLGKVAGNKGMPPALLASVGAPRIVCSTSISETVRAGRLNGSSPKEVGPSGGAMACAPTSEMGRPTTDPLQHQAVVLGSYVRRAATTEAITFEQLTILRAVRFWITR